MRAVSSKSQGGLTAAQTNGAIRYNKNKLPKSRLSDLTERFYLASDFSFFMSENNSEVTESVSIPPTEAVEANNEAAQSASPDVSTPFEDSDVWADFGKGKAETEEEKVQEVKAEEKEETKSETIEPEKSELSDEDALLEEIFSDEELESVTKEQIIESQTSRRAKKRAEQNFELAEIVKDYQGDKPIEEVMTKFESLAPERFKILSETAAHKLVDSNPDGTFRRAYVAEMLKQNPNYDWRSEQLPTIKDFVDFKNGNGNQSSNHAQPADLANAIAELDKTLDFDWRDEGNDGEFIDERELALVQTVRALEAQHKAVSEEKEKQSKEYEDLKKEVNELKNGFKTETDSKLQTETLRIVNDYRDSVQAKLLPLIAKNTGLEITENDSSEIKGFKERRLALYTGTPYEKANNLPSQFEFFAYHESSVKDEINLITDRIVKAQIEEAKAALAGNTEEAKRHKASADSERIPMMEMLAKANKEFKASYITPDLDLLEKFSSSLSTQINQAAQRVEVASGSAQGAIIQLL